MFSLSIGFPVLTGGKAFFTYRTNEPCISVQSHRAVVKWSEDKVEKRSLFANSRSHCR